MRGACEAHACTAQNTHIPSWACDQCSQPDSKPPLWLTDDINAVVALVGTAV
jgi:hypothetical protein